MTPGLGCVPSNLGRARAHIGQNCSPCDHMRTTLVEFSPILAQALGWSSARQEQGSLGSWARNGHPSANFVDRWRFGLESVRGAPLWELWSPSDREVLRDLFPTTQRAESGVGLPALSRPGRSQPNVARLRQNLGRYWLDLEAFGRIRLDGGQFEPDFGQDWPFAAKVGQFGPSSAKVSPFRPRLADVGPGLQWTQRYTVRPCFRERTGLEKVHASNCHEVCD